MWAGKKAWLNCLFSRRVWVKGPVVRLCAPIRFVILNDGLHIHSSADMRLPCIFCHRIYIVNNNDGDNNKKKQPRYTRVLL